MHNQLRVTINYATLYAMYFVREERNMTWIRDTSLRLCCLNFPKSFVRPCIHLGLSQKRQNFPHYLIRKQNTIDSQLLYLPLELKQQYYAAQSIKIVSLGTQPIQKCFFCMRLLGLSGNI